MRVAIGQLDRLLRLRQLSGTNWRERAVAALGASLAIGAAGAISALIVGSHAALLLAAPIGASAVILFAVPSSPLGQPWPVIGGTTLSIACGILATQLLGHGPLAAGLAVGASILLMSATRSLHPPGGGCALLAVLGGPELLAKGYWLALVPGGLNAALLVVAGLVFHRCPPIPISCPRTSTPRSKRHTKASTSAARISPRCSRRRSVTPWRGGGADERKAAIPSDRGLANPR